VSTAGSGDQRHAQGNSAQAVGIDLALELIVGEQITHGQDEQQDAARHHEIGHCDAEQVEDRRAQREKGQRHRRRGGHGVKDRPTYLVWFHALAQGEECGQNADRVHRHEQGYEAEPEFIHAVDTCRV